MFEDLSKDLNIYALTASNAKEGALMCYCNDKPFNIVCLGDELQTGWIESARIANLRSCTFRDHSELIKRAVTWSHPQMFGDFSILDLPLQAFFSSGHAREQGVSQVQARSKPIARTDSDSVPMSTMHLNLLQRPMEARPEDVKTRLQLVRHQAMMADVAWTVSSAW